MQSFLDFEKPIAELEGKIEELRHLSDESGIRIAEEVERLQTRVERLLGQTYSKLTPWQKVQVARHPGRPHCLDYVRALIDEFTPLAGDRLYAEDHAMIGGIGRFKGRSCVIIGQEKGTEVNSRMKHNFGMARPEGYRKAQRLMRLADQFQLPVITFVDTAGAYPGIGAEERGQAEAIARSMEAGIEIEVPIVSVVIGEGGSGGAIAIAIANTVMMLEHAVYSVISPEGCASILWRNADHTVDAANSLRLTSENLLEHGIIDKIIEEPVGAAHRDPEATIASVGSAIGDALDRLCGIEGAKLRQMRRDKFLGMGNLL